jgi:pimeloyl-ACP methyl ester carboxylesterase
VKRFDRPLVILVHGLWMTGVEMGLLARRLRAAGFCTRAFRYVSVIRDVPQHAARLADFLRKVDGPQIHFIGHSMGGLLVQHALYEFKGARIGRVVALGTPFGGSWAARQILQYGWLRPILGKPGQSLASGSGQTWGHLPELGIIAGELSFGSGKLLGEMPQPNDGTVTVEETRCKGAKAHLTLRVTHYGLLFSPKAAAQAIHFLNNGTFATEV